MSILINLFIFQVDRVRPGPEWPDVGLKSSPKIVQKLGKLRSLQFLIKEAEVF